MAEIDLEDLKRLVAAIDGKDGLDKTGALANLSLGPVPIALACRVLELAAEVERQAAGWKQAFNIGVAQQERAEAAEAKLREIDSHLLEWAHDPSLDWPRNQISRILKLARPE